MQPDPNGSAAETSAPDTATAASGAPEQGSTPEAVAVAEDHDEGAATDREPTPESDEDPAEDDGDDEGAESSEQTEEQKKLSRRERQRLREAERIERERQAAIEEYKRTQQAEAERAKREAEAQKAREQAAKEFAEYIGEEGETDRLDSEISGLKADIDGWNDRIRAEIGTLTQEQFDDLESKIAAHRAEIAAKEARKVDIKKARGFQDKIAHNIWNGIEGQLLSVLRHPEFSDPAARQRYLQAEGGIAGALDVMRDVVRTAAIAEKDAEIAQLKAEHDSTVKTLREEMRGWRVRAGAEEVPDTTGGGQSNGSGTVYTRERLSQMLSTPEGIAEYRRNRAEIERQERAGLIR